MSALEPCCARLACGWALGCSHGMPWADDVWLGLLAVGLAWALRACCDAERHSQRFKPAGPCCRRFKSSLALNEAVTLGHLQEGKKTLLGSLGALFGSGAGEGADPAAAAKRADLFIALNASTVGVLAFWVWV